MFRMKTIHDHVVFVVVVVNLLFKQQKYETKILKTYFSQYFIINLEHVMEL